MPEQPAASTNKTESHTVEIETIDLAEVTPAHLRRLAAELVEELDANPSLIIDFSDLVEGRRIRVRKTIRRSGLP